MAAYVRGSVIASATSFREAICANLRLLSFSALERTVVPLLRSLPLIRSPDLFLMGARLSGLDDQAVLQHPDTICCPLPRVGL